MSKHEEQLATWESLNAALREEATGEEACWKLLKHEQENQARLNFLLRIYGRANRLRTERERGDIAKGLMLHKSKPATQEK